MPDPPNDWIFRRILSINLTAYRWLTIPQGDGKLIRGKVYVDTNP